MIHSASRRCARGLGFAALLTGIALGPAIRGAEPDPDPDPSSSKQKLDGPEVQVYPPTISLNSDRDYQGFIAVLRREDGVTVDITEQADWAVMDESLVKIENGNLYPIADGATELACTFGGTRVTIPVEVKGATVHPPISFTKHVMPVLTRSGCNTGSCHGAARGKDGFNLSLFGFDPVGDYQRITREIGFRRINLARPDQSLFLLKAIGAVPHTGGKLFEADSPYYATILEWLQNEAPADPAENMPPAVESVAIYPPQAVIEGEGSGQRFLAVATYADGTTRDVTTLAAFSSNNTSGAEIDQAGRVIAGSRGEAFVMARFDTHTVGSQVLTLPTGLEYTPPAITGNYVDQLVGKKLQQLRILPSGLCSDEEFLRRVTIDITGLLPTEEEYRQFVNDAEPNKRAELIDRLLERKEFSEIWAMKFAQLIMIKSSNQVSYKSAFLYNQWLTDQFARSVPIDQMVRDLLGSSGGTFNTPQTNFYQIERDTLKTAENVAQVFMGIRTQCAQCHNHPFDRWTMDDYYGFAAFFSQIGRKQGEDYRETIVFNRFGGEVNHPLGGRKMDPKFLGGDAPETAGKDRREVLADWLTQPDNPYFATSIANRVWAHFMGSGLVDPVDDIRISNPASNPELFQELGNRLAEYKFDFKRLVRDICNSQAYQRSSLSNESNQSDTRNYAFATIRRIPAESLLDCLSQVTQTKDKFRGLPLGARAVQIADGSTSTYFLDTFGRAPRNTVCDCEATTDPSLSQALHLLNGESVHQKVLQGQLVKQLLEEKKTPEQVIELLYIRALCRQPTPEETKLLTDQVAEAANVQQGLEDVFWAILNSREYVFNH
ncbi:DUF1549 domain-containing protein [Planctomycetaceae bacterium SH139]